jgi:four helix bundle protein
LEGVVTKVYEIVSEFPKEEKYSLVDQIKRSVVSIPSNVVHPVE